MYSHHSIANRHSSCPSSTIIDEDRDPTWSRRHGEPRDGWSMFADNSFNHGEGVSVGQSTMK